MTANVSISSVSDLSGRRIYIEDVYPSVDGGRFAVKRIAGEPVEVWADIFRDGHAVLAADLLWRADAADKWARAPMRPPRPGRSAAASGSLQVSVVGGPWRSRWHQ